MRIIRFLAPAALAALTAGVASAAPLSLPGSGRAGDPFAPTFAAIVSVPSRHGAGFTTAPPRNEAIRYRERGGNRSRSRGGNESPAQLHFGFFDPDGDGGDSFVFGLRGGPQVDPHVQIGGMVDWVHRTENQRVVAGDPYMNGSVLVQPERILSSASTNLFPMLLFMQVSGDENMPVIPYGGIAGGYQLLFLSANDYTTGQSFDGTYGGWGWQAWVGVGLPLSGQARLAGELFVNQATPERDVDASNGLTYRERVDQDGVGMRFGLQWGF